MAEVLTRRVKVGGKWYPADMPLKESGLTGKDLETVKADPSLVSTVVTSVEAQRLVAQDERLEAAQKELDETLGKRQEVSDKLAKAKATLEKTKQDDPKLKERMTEVEQLQAETMELGISVARLEGAIAFARGT